MVDPKWNLEDDLTQNPILTINHAPTPDQLVNAMATIKTTFTHKFMGDKWEANFDELARTLKEEMSLPAKKSGGMIIVKVHSEQHVTISKHKALQMVYSMNNNMALMMGQGGSISQFFLFTVIPRGKHLLIIKSIAMKEDFNLYKNEFLKLVQTLQLEKEN